MRATTRRVFVAGPAGRIECAVDSPEGSPRGYAVIAHPHPQFGGTLDNKVVQTLARAFVELGYEAWRPNFRGVGQSEGRYDEGRGELEDLAAVVAQLNDKRIVLAGFSFGAAMQARLAAQVKAERLVLVGTAVINFDVPPVPRGSLVIHGEQDTTVPLAAVLDWARPQDLPLLGEPVPRRAREARTRVGVVPQFDNLDPDFTVAENLLVYGRYFGMKSAEVKARIPALLHFAGLAGRADSRIATLSGGMKRRLTLGRALVNDPQLVVMDEPTTGLDPQARHLIWERLRRLTQEGKTLVLTTHFMEEAERLCHRLAILDNGRIIAEGSPRALIAEHIESQVVEVHGTGYEAWMGARE